MAARGKVQAIPLIDKIDRTLRWLSDGTPRTRLVVCLLVLAVLFMRLPSAFLRPELWAEDSTFFADAYNYGSAALLMPMGGAYYNLYGTLIAGIALHFPPITWPWFAIYAAHAAAIAAVYLVTSPRFDMPYRALAALAVVTVPLYDIFGGLANAQWVLATVVFVLPLLRAGPRWLLVPEAIAAGVTGLAGPYSAFAVPIYAWRLWTCAAAERGRLVLLGGITACCALVQFWLALHSDHFTLIEAAPYDHTVWLTMPVRWLDWLRVAGFLQGHMPALIAATFVLWAAVAWSVRKGPRRGLQMAMLLFATAILYSGMLKYRHHVLLMANDRYVFAGALFAIWMLCLVASAQSARRGALVASLVLALLVVNTARRALETKPTASVPWAEEVGRIGKGPVEIPIAPGDWTMRLHH